MGRTRYHWQFVVLYPIFQILTSANFFCRLTAFVMKLYAQSSRYIAIDPNQVTTSLTWIVRQQSSDGHFNKVGKIVDRYILVSITYENVIYSISVFTLQGGLEGDVARTAFVLISLIEAKNAEALPVRAKIMFTVHNSY